MALLAVSGMVAANIGMSGAAGGVPAPVPASSQFDITGFPQKADLDPTCVAAAGESLDAQGNPQVAHCGGTVMINGVTITIPSETVVILPASAMTWQELFANAPGTYAPTQTGMALGDSPKPYTTYEFNVIGNHVIDPNGKNGCILAAGCDRYIAGLVHVSQQDLNGTSGYINYINYLDGSFEVGGKLGVPGTGALVRINDPAATDPVTGDPILDDNGSPTGRFGRAFTPDVRFQVDQDNPTVGAETGFPMCIPRYDPAVLDDTLCPQGNRPLSSGLKDPITGQQHPTPAGVFDTFWTMNAPGTGFPDPTRQAPLEVGDPVSYAGTLIQGADGAPDYIAAHTVVASLGIYTQAGIDPAYTSIEVTIVGTGGLTVFGAGEAAVRTKFEGMTTDPSRNVHLYGIDINPVTGETTDRDFGTVGVDPGPPGGAVKGRWRYRPPCKADGVTILVSDKNCQGPAGGSYLPPPREVRAVVEGLQSQDPQNVGAGCVAPCATTAANGIFYGQYHAPVGEYIFPENVPGQPIPENNFNTIDFLAYGGYASITGVQAGVLSPWPSNVLPVPLVAATPTILGAPYSVANGGSINLSGVVNADASAPTTVKWTAGTVADGTNLNGALTNASTTAPSFNATGLAAGTYFLSFSATNVMGTVTAHTTIVVQDAPAPTINPIAAQTVPAGSFVTMNASSASQPAPAFSWIQVASGAPTVVLNTTGLPNGSRATFTAATAGTYLFDVTATNGNGTSPATRVTITVTPTATQNIVLATEYRTGKQRLIITATTGDLTVTSMILQPYKLDNGTTFNPASLGASFTNGGGGVWTITVVGALPPACNNNPARYVTPCSQSPLIVTSTGGAAPGTSAFTPLQKIRN